MVEAQWTEAENWSFGIAFLFSFGFSFVFVCKESDLLTGGSTIVLMIEEFYGVVLSNTRHILTQRAREVSST
jgi:hypothetical protein